VEGNASMLLTLTILVNVFGSDAGAVDLIKIGMESKYVTGIVDP
jgi:hypothetical protein